MRLLQSENLKSLHRATTHVYSRLVEILELFAESLSTYIVSAWHPIQSVPGLDSVHTLGTAGSRLHDASFWEMFYCFCQRANQRAAALERCRSTVIRPTLVCLRVWHESESAGRPWTQLPFRVLKFSFLCICLAASGNDKEGESTFDVNRGGRMQSIEEDKVSSGSTLNQAEKATSRYELGNNVAPKENDLTERTEENESKVLNQESRDKRKKVTFKVTRDSAENTSSSNNEMEEGISSSKGICFEANWSILIKANFKNKVSQSPSFFDHLVKKGG